MKKVNVIQNEEKPIAVDVIAESILEISKAMKALGKSKLKRDTIVTLIASKSGLYKNSVNTVLDHLESLEKDYLK